MKQYHNFYLYYSIYQFKQMYFSIVLTNTREGGNVYVDRQPIITMWVLPSEMTCHMHILLMSGKLPVFVDHYTLTALGTFF